MLLDKLKMEFLGTFLFIYLTGMAYIQLKLEVVDLTAAASASFVAYALLLWCGKAVSGAHYNPIITIFLIVSKHMKVTNGLLYVFFQLVATIFATSMLKISTPASILQQLKDNSILGFPLLTINPFKAIILEMIGSFLIVFGYYMLIVERSAPKYVYGAGMGAILFADMIFLYEKTGCSLNPLRSLAYSMINHKYTQLYVFLIGPMLGGVLGSLLGNLLLSEKAERSRLRKKEAKKKKKQTMINKMVSETE